MNTAARQPKVKRGDVVRIIGVPPQIKGMPRETRSLFRRCLDHTFVVAGVSKEGLIELDVSKVKRLNTIWIEPECVRIFRHRTRG